MTTGKFLISTTDWSLVGVVFTQSDFSVSSYARSAHAPTNSLPLAQVICPPTVMMSPSLGVVFVGREVGSDEDGDCVTVSVTRTVCVGCGVSVVCGCLFVVVTVTVAGAGLASNPDRPQPEANNATTPIKLASGRCKTLPIFFADGVWGFTSHDYSFLVVDYLISRRIL